MNPSFEFGAGAVLVDGMKVTFPASSAFVAAFPPVALPVEVLELPLLAELQDRYLLCNPFSPMAPPVDFKFGPDKTDELSDPPFVIVVLVVDVEEEEEVDVLVRVGFSVSRGKEVGARGGCGLKRRRVSCASISERMELRSWEVSGVWERRRSELLTSVGEEERGTGISMNRDMRCSAVVVVVVVVAILAVGFSLNVRVGCLVRKSGRCRVGGWKASCSSQS